MNRATHLFRVFLAAFLGTAPVVAATLETAQVHFTVFALRPIDNILFRPGAEAPAIPVKFFPTARSPECSAAADTPIAFTDSTSSDVVATAIIPAPITKALLIFVPIGPRTTGARPEYEIRVLDDSSLHHASAGVRFVNLSGLNLAGRLGARAITLGNGLSPTYKADASTELLLETEHGGRRFRSYSNAIDLAAGERAVLILFPPYYSGSLEVQGRLLVDAPDPTPAIPPQVVPTP